jgi:hypothetical protein
MGASLDPADECDGSVHGANFAGNAIVAATKAKTQIEI